VAWIVGIPVASMFSSFRVHHQSHGILTKVTAITTLSASGTPCNAPGKGDARRRLARRVFLRSFVFWLLLPTKMGKTITFAVAAVFYIL